MFLYNHFHRHKHALFGLSDFGEFQAASYLHVIGRSLISVFIPILLLTSGFAINQVLWYYFLYHVIDIPLNFFARWMITNIGAKWTTIFAVVCELGFFGLLAVITPAEPLLLVLLAVLAALFDTGYWVANIFLFLMTTKKRSTKSSTGLYYALSEMAALAGPAIGAGILVFANDQALIWASIGILLLSFVPLFYIQKMDDKPKERILPRKTFFKERAVRESYASYGLWAIHRGAEAILWPTFIFMTFQSIESVAIIPVIASLTYAIFSYGTGRLKHLKREPLIILGGIIVALFWFLRLEIDHAWLYYVSVMVIGIFSVLVDVPMDSGIFAHGKKQDPLSTSTWQNAIGMGSKAVLFGLLLILTNVFHMSFVIAMSAVLALILLNALYFLHKKHHLPPYARVK